MSSTVRSYGLIALLAIPLSEDVREDLSEMLWDADTDLDINYTGELVILDHMRSKSLDEREDIYSLNIGNSNPEDHRLLIAEATKFGLVVDVTKILPFNCIWYNGSDSPVNMLTKDEFLKHFQEEDGYSGNLDLFPDLLPDWAYGVNQAKDLEVGTQLCTKDGRRCGNARIMEVKRSEEPMSFLVRTDAGSEMVCTVNEIHEIWTIGPYFIKPVQAL